MTNIDKYLLINNKYLLISYKWLSTYRLTNHGEKLFALPLIQVITSYGNAKTG
jgi:hypothetical protein